MKKKRVVSGPISGPLTEDYEDRGPGAASVKGMTLAAQGSGGAKRPSLNAAQFTSPRPGGE